MKFTLPELGEGVHEGEMVSWKVKPGDQVKYDQPLCEIMTDKATVEIPSAFQGKVAELHAKEGETVHVGQLLLTFEGESAAASKSVAPAAKAPAPSAPAPSMSAAPAASAMISTDPSSRPLAAPSVRREAREMGVNLTSVAGSGPNGRIMRDDLKNGGGNGRAVGGTVAAGAPSYIGTGIRAEPGHPFKNEKQRPQGGEERVPFKGLRKKIAEKMRISKDHAAHFTYVEECDATELVRLRAAAKEIGAKQGIKVTYLPIVMKAMVSALRRYPILNSSYDESTQELVYKHYFNIGLSVQTEDGLTAPVVKGVEHKGILEIAKDIQEVVERARNKKLTQDDFAGGTITLTNAGSIGGLFATPIINYPEVAILGFNKIFRKPVAVTRNGVETIEVRDWTYFSISLDHRVVDGAIAAEFLKLFISYIENPGLLALEG